MEFRQGRQILLSGLVFGVVAATFLAVRSASPIGAEEQASERLEAIGHLPTGSPTEGENLASESNSEGGQTSTPISFRSLESGSVGNFLDGVQVRLGS